MVDCSNLFGFSGLKQLNAESFSKPQWGFPKIGFILYRAVALLYWLAVVIACLVLFDDTASFFYYLSHLGQLVILLYLAVALICSLIDVAHGKSKKISGDSPAKWYHWLALVLYVVSFDNALMVSISYPLVFGQDTATSTLEFANFHKHILNSLLMFFDLFLNGIPVRFWYFPFATAWALFYAVVAVSLHLSGVNSALYEPMDYENAPVKAWLVTVAVFLFCPVMAQLLMCGMFALKTWLVKRFDARKAKQFTADTLKEAEMQELSKLEYNSTPVNGLAAAPTRVTLL